MHHSSDELYCAICEVLATSTSQLEAHLDGKSHQRHASMAELMKECQNRTQPPAVVADPKDLHCDICDVETPSATHKEFHLRYGFLPQRITPFDAETSVFSYG